MRGEMDQVAAVQIRNDFYSRRKDSVVQLVHFLMNGLQRGLGFCSLSQKHDAFHDIVVIDYFSVFTMNRFSNLAQPDFGTLHYCGNVFHTQWRAVLRFSTGCSIFWARGDTANRRTLSHVL